jgi:hypothetical protein
MGEAVGTMYEMLAGLGPLTPLVRARASLVQPATRANFPPELAGPRLVVGHADGRLTALALPANLP